MSSPHTLTPRLAFLLTLPPLMWAGNAVLGKLVVGAAPPVALNALRWVVALIILAPLARGVWRDWGALRARWPYLALLGFLGMGCYNALQYGALHTSTPLNVTLIAASMPAWMLAVGALGWRVRPRRNHVLGALASVAGVLLVLSGGELERLARLRFVAGDLLMLAAVVCWSFYSWLLARPPASMRAPQRPAWDWAAFLFAQCVFGAAWSVAASGVEWALGGGQWHWSPALAAIVLFVAIGPSVIAFRCWGLGVATVGPAVAALFGNLTPLFTAVMAAAWLGLPPAWYHVVAFALIAAGIAWSARP